MRTRIMAGMVLLCTLAGCAAPTTQLAPVAKEEVAAEEAIQRELVLRELAGAQDRLNALTWPLLAAASPLCSSKTGYRFGFAVATAHDWKGDWAFAARNALGVSDSPSVLSITPGSPAGRAGLERGDRILAVNGVPVPAGRTARDLVLKAINTAGANPIELRVRRDSADRAIRMAPELICNLGAEVIADGDLNAFADGKRIIFPWAMMRFANDDELRTVIAHEIAHNAMGHIEARRKNATLGAIFGAIADVALATQGVNTQGQYTSSFMEAAARAYSQDFEREADYVGMYLMARAGVPLAAGPNLWRQFAQINPTAIGYASTHPTTAERFVRLRSTIQEIERKRAQGAPLLPEMKTKPRSG